MVDVSRDQYNLRASTASRRVHKCVNGSKEPQELKACDKQWISLMRETRQLRKSLDLTHFLLGSLERMSCLLGPTESCQAPVLTLSPLCYSEEGQRMSKVLKREQMEVERILSYATAQNNFLTCLLRRINSAILTASSNAMLVAQDGPKDAVEKPFYRYHRTSCRTSPSASIRKTDIGILSPSWTKGPSADTEIKREHIVQHLTEWDTSSPPFISISDSPGRIHNLIKADKQRTTDSAVVLVISRAKLQTMDVRFQRSTDLVREFGVETHSRHPKGVHYVTESHWMAFRWIPAECIVAEIAVERFKAFCAAHGIVAQDSAGSCTPKYEIRPPLDDVLEFKADDSAKKAKVRVGSADGITEGQESVEHAVDKLAAGVTEMKLGC